MPKRRPSGPGRHHWRGRFELTLSYRCREIAILLVGFHRDSAFELYAHRLAGRAAGLSEEEIEALATPPGPPLEAAEERAVYAAARAMLERGTLDGRQYRAAVEALGARGIFELVVLVGYYQLVATQRAVFGVVPPALEKSS